MTKINSSSSRSFERIGQSEHRSVRLPGVVRLGGPTVARIIVERVFDQTIVPARDFLLRIRHRAAPIDVANLRLATATNLQFHVESKQTHPTPLA